MTVPDRALLRLCDCERDHEERNADPVVQPALDVEALAHAVGEARRGDDRLAERRVGGREDDREEERLRPGEVTQERDRYDEPRHDRQRQADSQQAHRNAERPSQRLQVDARCVGEQDDGQRRLGQGLDARAGRGGVDEVERLDADDETRRREDHRRGDPGSVDPGRDGREAEEDERREPRAASARRQLLRGWQPGRQGYGAAVPEWDPDVEIDEALVRALLADQFSELDATSARLLGEGWDNSVWVVEEEWAFRFPRRAIAIPGVERELAVLPRLAPLLPVPIPSPIRRTTERPLPVAVLRRTASCRT